MSACHLIASPYINMQNCTTFDSAHNISMSCLVRKTADEYGALLSLRGGRCASRGLAVIVPLVSVKVSQAVVIIVKFPCRMGLSLW